MKASSPHYLLFSDFREDAEAGRWRFVLQRSDGAERLEADDLEHGVVGQRLELFTVVRGLEAIGQPSRVTLVTSSDYVREGIRRGLKQWRQNGWRWECFGQMVPVKNLDLWQRVDRALRFHQVECRRRRFDPPHRQGHEPCPPPHRRRAAVSVEPWHDALRSVGKRISASARRAVLALQRWRRTLARPLVAQTD